MKREIMRTTFFAFTVFILFSCSHKIINPNQKRSIASQKNYHCTGMYDPFLESEMELELTSNPLFFRAEIIENDQFDSNKKNTDLNIACYGTHSANNDKNFAKFETFIVPTDDARNSQGFTCETSSIKISKNAGRDTKWPAILFPKSNPGDGIWFSCQ